MKKFKTKKTKFNYRLLIYIVIFIILFTLASFLKLNNSYSNFVNMLLSKYSKEDLQNSFINLNLDNLMNNYYFKENITLYNDKSNEIYLLDNDITNEISNCLLKLGIKAIVIKENEIINYSDKLIINIKQTNSLNSIVTIDNDNYIKVMLIASEMNNLIKNITDYLNSNYPGILVELSKNSNNKIITIEIGEINYNKVAFENTIKLLSLSIKNSII